MAPLKYKSCVVKKSVSIKKDKANVKGQIIYHMSIQKFKQSEKHNVRVLSEVSSLKILLKKQKIF